MPVILSERSESKNPPRVGGTSHQERSSNPQGTLRLRDLGGRCAQGDRGFVIGSERVREGVEESPEGWYCFAALITMPRFGGPFDSAASEAAPLRVTVSLSLGGNESGE